MPFYEDFGRKPPRKDSRGPEEGYRPRGERGAKPAGKPGYEKKGDSRFDPKGSPQGKQFGRPAPTSGPAPRRQDAVGPEGGYRSRGERGGQAVGKPGYEKKTDARFDPKARPAGKQFGRPAPSSGPAPAQRPARPTRPVAPVSPPMRTPFDGDEPMPRENILSGRNPIREAIKSGRDIERLLVAKGELSGSAREIVAMAREQHIVVQVVERIRLDEITQNHQGMIAFASAFRYATVEDMFERAKERGEEPLLVVLDGVTDPHNLGAIIRTAECAGAHGVIVPERRAVGLTPAAVKASAGAVEYLPVARTGNLSRLLESLKAKGLWIAAADMEGEPYAQADLTGPLALVVGGEGSGVTRLVLSGCDRRVALPLKGKIDSLNASVAAGVLLYEVRRQRG